ncbi:15320_t:CDS:1, partial [Funneliformis caledonium]
GRGSDVGLDDFFSGGGNGVGLDVGLLGDGGEDGGKFDGYENGGGFNGCRDGGRLGWYRSDGCGDSGSIIDSNRHQFIIGKQIDIFDTGLFW